MKRPTDDGAVETVATSDLIPSDTPCSTAVTGDPLPTNDDDLVADVAVPADEMQDNSSSVLATSDASSAAATMSSAAVTDTAVDCDSVVTGSSSAAEA